MPKNIAVILGHPDPSETTFCSAIAKEYATAAVAAGHNARRIDVAKLDFAILRQSVAFYTPPTAPDIVAAQEVIRWADHLVFIYPLWLGTMPALLKAFLEQMSCGGFIIETSPDSMKWAKKLKGKSARIVVTMGMPALIYRWVFRAHSLKSFERNILGFAGVGPIRETVIGMVEKSLEHRKRWLSRIADLGRRGV